MGEEKEKNINIHWQRKWMHHQKDTTDTAQELLTPYINVSEASSLKYSVLNGGGGGGGGGGTKKYYSVMNGEDFRHTYDTHVVTCTCN